MPETPLLTFEEARVFGALIEKSQATPEYYPMTLNALVNACNQKSSRDPVVDFDESVVEIALGTLKDKGLVAFASGTGRVVKYLHRAGQNGLGLTPAQACAVAIMLLRGPQTPGEIRARAGRQFTYPSMEVVQETITGLLAREHPTIEELPRQPGQKERRYRHCFFQYPDDGQISVSPATGPALRPDAESLARRIAALEEEHGALLRRLEALESLLRRPPSEAT